MVLVPVETLPLPEDRFNEPLPPELTVNAPLPPTPVLLSVPPEIVAPLIAHEVMVPVPKLALPLLVVIPPLAVSNPVTPRVLEKFPVVPLIAPP